MFDIQFYFGKKKKKAPIDGAMYLLKNRSIIKVATNLKENMTKTVRKDFDSLCIITFNRQVEVKVVYSLLKRSGQCKYARSGHLSLCRTRLKNVEIV